MIVLLALAAAVQVAPAAQLEPLAFLVGHCWQGDIQPGVNNVHCFDTVEGGRVRDRHDVIRNGETVYSGETIYSWDATANAAAFVYSSGGAEVGRGHVREIAGGLDFGRNDYGSGSDRVSVASRWARVGGDAYDAIDTSATAAHNRTTRYTRMAAAPVRMLSSTAADGRRTLVHELVVPAPADQVFAALTTADGWKSWAVPHAWVDPANANLLETSYGANPQPGEATNIRQEFLVRLPNRLIVFRTVQTPAGFPHADEYKQIVSLIELTPEGAGTRIRLTGIGYAAGAPGDALLGMFREANRMTLEQLRARFVTGPIDWAARQRAAHAR